MVTRLFQTCRTAFLLCFVAWVGAFPVSVPAQVNSWINPANGNRDQAANW
jgi:hypothetical protein